MASPVSTLRQVSPEVVVAAVIAGDGEIESFDGQGPDLEGVLAPLGTTLSALAARAVQELGRGGLQTMVLEGSQGHVIARELGDGRTLVAVAGPGARLGLLLDDVRFCAEAVARA